MLVVAGVALRTTVTRRSRRVSSASGVTWPRRASVDRRASLERARDGFREHVVACHRSSRRPAGVPYVLSPAHVRSVTPIISAAEIHARIQALAAGIRHDAPDADLHFIGVLKGSVFFLTDLLRAMKGTVTMDFIAVSSYAGDQDHRRSAAAQGRRPRPAGPPCDHRRRHRRHRADPALPAGSAAGARAEVPQDGVSAHEALTPQGRRAGRLHRLLDRRHASSWVTASTSTSTTVICRSSARSLRDRSRHRQPQPCVPRPARPGASSVRTPLPRISTCAVHDRRVDVVAARRVDEVRHRIVQRRLPRLRSCRR